MTMRNKFTEDVIVLLIKWRFALYIGHDAEKLHHIIFFHNFAMLIAINAGPASLEHI